MCNNKYYSNNQTVGNNFITLATKGPLGLLSFKTFEL